MSITAHGQDILLVRNHREGSSYSQFDTHQKVTPSEYYSLRGRSSIRIVWYTHGAEQSADFERFKSSLSVTQPEAEFRRVADWYPEVTPLESRHEPHEATGGYVECECGWPTREQFNSREPYIRHVIAEAVGGIPV